MLPPGKPLQPRRLTQGKYLRVSSDSPKHTTPNFWRARSPPRPWHPSAAFRTGARTPRGYGMGVGGWFKHRLCLHSVSSLLPDQVPESEIVDYNCVCGPMKPHVPQICWRAAGHSWPELVTYPLVPCVRPMPGPAGVGELPDSSEGEFEGASPKLGVKEGSFLGRSALEAKT